MLELCQMPNNAPKLAAERRALRGAQILDLLGEVSPVELQIRPAMLRSPQGIGLSLRPEDEILVVEPFRIHHARSRRVAPITSILHNGAPWKNSPSDPGPTTRG